jgi:uncharacterized membrane protein YgdD (TMEM256/DUF423 family)
MTPGPKGADAHRVWLAAAGVAGALGVILGAVSAHLAATGAQPDIDLASRFLLFHAAALLGVAALMRPGTPWLRIAGALFILGCLCFCGGLCLIALVDRGFAPLVPVGGTILILGWLALVVAAFAGRPAADG